MMRRLENSFAYSHDVLGEAVWPFVKAVGQAEAHLDLLEREEGDFDILHEDLFGVCNAYLQLFSHLLACGIDGVRNEILADTVSRNGGTVTCAEGLR